MSVISFGGTAKPVFNALTTNGYDGYILENNTMVFYYQNASMIG